MPKKGKKDEGSAQFEFDPSIYIRREVDLNADAIGEHSHEAPLMGVIANIETLFPEWDIADEDWNEPLTEQQLVQIEYPDHLKIESISTISSLFQLNSSENNGTETKSKKKEKKNTSAAATNEIIEKVIDENGNPLPVMYASTVTKVEEAVTINEQEHLDFKLEREFQIIKSDEVLKLEETIQKLEEKISQLKERISAEPENAKLPGQLAATEEKLVSVRSEIMEKASKGIEVDQNLCNAYRTIASFVPIVVNHQLDSSEPMDFALAESHVMNELEENYLWRAIYPKLPNGKPYLNPAGKYCVKLYLAGKWRKVYVDDSIPLRADGLPAVASSENRFELWPLILAKAIYTVYSACGYSQRMADVCEPVEYEARHGPHNHSVCHKVSHFVAFIIHIMTGWQPHNPVSVRQLFLNHPTKSAKLLQSIIAEGISNIDQDDVVLEGLDFPWDLNDDSDGDDDTELILDEDGNLIRASSEYDESGKTGFGSGLTEDYASTAAFTEDMDNLDDEMDQDEDYVKSEQDTDNLDEVKANTALNAAASFTNTLPTVAEDKNNISRRVGFGDDTVYEMQAHSADSKADEALPQEYPEVSQAELEENDYFVSDNAEDTYADDDIDVDNLGEDSAELPTISEEENNLLFDANGKLLKTKKTFEMEYQKRKDFYNSVVAAIADREEKLSKIDSMLEQTLTEVFMIVMVDEKTGESHVAPILGICYSKEQPKNLLRARILVRWEKAAPESTEIIINPTPNNPISKHIDGVDYGPLPYTTPLKQRWFTIRQLVLKNGFIVGIDTQTLTPFEHFICRHWTPMKDPEGEETNERDKKGGGKAAPSTKAKSKGAEVETEAPKPLYFKDPGASPITLLKLDTSQFYSQDAPFASTIIQQGPNQDFGSFSSNASGGFGGSSKKLRKAVKEEKRKFMRQGSSAEAEAQLLESMQLENQRAHPNGLLRRASTNQHHHHAKADFLHFTMMMHADVVLKYAEPKLNDSDGGVSLQRAYSDDDCSLATAATTDEHKKLPSDVVLVLQELRFDDVDPLVFVMQMKDNVYLPMVTKSFAISAKRLPKNPNEPLFFWLRLFTRTSVYLHCSSEVPVVIGEAEQMWRDLGKPVYAKGGRMGLTGPHTQQLLFRLPLVIDPTANDDNSTIPGCTEVDDDISINSNSHTPNDSSNTSAVIRQESMGASIDAAEASDEVKPLVSVSQQSSPFPPHHSQSSGASKTSTNLHADSVSKTCMAFLYVANRSIERNLTMALLGSDVTKLVSPFPRIQGNILYLSKDPETASTLIGRIFPADIPGVELTHVPEFDWKLIILSNSTIQETPKPINTDAISHRYRGSYIPNSKHIVFRDVFQFEKYSFPLAIRLTAACDEVNMESIEAKNKRLHAEEKDNDALAKLLPSAMIKALQSPGRFGKTGICMSLKMYRLSDMKLIVEYRGSSSILCYYQKLEPFLEEGETFDFAAAYAEKDAADAAAAKDTGKGGKKKKPEDTTADAAAKTAKVLIECTLDDYRMNIPADWKSRFPHYFDQLYEIDAPGADQHRIFLDRQGDGLNYHPPREAKFKWQMDILAGKVIEASHDTSTVERWIELKNSWGKDGDRVHRRDGALKYFRERRSVESTVLRERLNQLMFRNGYDSEVNEEHNETKADSSSNNKLVKKVFLSGLSSDPLVHQSSDAGTIFDSNVSAPADKDSGITRHSAVMAPLTNGMIENLVSALEEETSILRNRYMLLHTIPKYLDHIEIMHQQEQENSLLQEKASTASSDGADVEEQMKEKRKALLHKEKVQAELRYQDISSRFVQLNVKMQEETKQRVEELVGEALTDATELGQLWEPREKFRSYVAERNESLAGLLKRACEAKAVALKAEEKAAEEAAKLAEKLRKEEEKKAKKAKK